MIRLGYTNDIEDTKIDFGMFGFGKNNKNALL